MQETNLVGIIPVAGPSLDFNFPWHDSLMPVGKDYLAIERSLVECATAGCRSIWIVCHDDMQPLVRHRLGEAIQDPNVLNRKNIKFTRMWTRTIPIYYVPVTVKEKKSKDSLVWSIIKGAKVAEKISKSMSKWTVPSGYYISFPYGTYLPHLAGVGQQRRSIHSNENYFFSKNGKTAIDNEFLALRLGMPDIDLALKKIKMALTGGVFGEYCAVNDDSGTIDEESSPGLLTHRYGPLSMSYAFSHLRDTPCTKNTSEVTWYYNIASWEGYKEYLSSEHYLERPIEFILKYREMVPLFREDV